MMWSKHSRRIDLISRSAKPFGQGESGANRFVPNAHGSQSACDDGAIDPIAITDHVTRSIVPRKSLGDLACDPRRRRIGCDVDPDEISAITPYNNQGIQQFEGNGRDHEQVHGGNVRSMVSHKGSPSLAGWLPSFDHVLGDGWLSEAESHLAKLAAPTSR